MRIDSHQHFWRYRAADYPWMSDGMTVLKRDWLPRDLKPLLEQNRFDSCIAVQARTSEAETDFLLGLASEHPWIAAVIGWADLTAEDLEVRLARWQERSKLAGFRHQVQDETDAAAFLDAPPFLRGVARLQAARRVYEVLVFSHQLDAASRFCARLDRHWLVLDHAGKPVIREGERYSWRVRLLPFRDMPHVLCKISGLVTEALRGDGTWDEAAIGRCLDVALEIFGAERVMYGSDWPVCLLAASYDNVYRIIERWAARLSPSERENLFGATAARCYGLKAVNRWT
ncbi:MAG: amidohydrolase family protein [Steroidobacterales bacterium]